MRPGLRGAAAALVLAMITQGCAGMFRSAGQNALAGARTELATPETHATIRQLADSSVASVDSAFRRDLAPSIESTWAGITSAADTTILGAEATMLRIEDSLAVALESRLAEALAKLIERNAEALGAGVRSEIPGLTAELAAGLSRDISPALVTAIGEGTREFMTQLSDGVRNQLADDLEKALRQAVGGAIEVGEEGGSNLLRNIGIGAGAFLLILAGILAYRDRKRHNETLAAVAQAIDKRGDEALKQQVREYTASRNVEGWFRDFLDKRGLLLSDRNGG